MNKRKIIKETIDKIKELSTKEKIDGLVLYTISRQTLNSLLNKESEGQDRESYTDTQDRENYINT